jgi:dolichyl-phosphate beta-glucosyltransferase
VVEKLSTPFLSIIIPAFNEEKRLPYTLEQLSNFLERQTYSYEVLVVENGSQDDTLEIAKDFAVRNQHFKAFHEQQRGKGLAVKRGMLSATGMYCFMCDADFSMPITEINRFFPPALIDTDIAIASREAAGSERIGEPFYRHLGGRWINTAIRLFVLPNLHDTQCGFKCFRREVAQDLFNAITLTGWSFDIELLYIARLRGYSVAEIPIPWYFNPESKLNVFQDALLMFRDILTIRLKAQRGNYHQTQ